MPEDCSHLLEMCSAFRTTLLSPCASSYKMTNIPKKSDDHSSIHTERESCLSQKILPTAEDPLCHCTLQEAQNLFRPRPQILRCNPTCSR